MSAHDSQGGGQWGKQLCLQHIRCRKAWPTAASNPNTCQCTAISLLCNRVQAANSCVCVVVVAAAGGGSCWS